MDRQFTLTCTRVPKEPPPLLQALPVGQLTVAYRATLDRKSNALEFRLTDKWRERAADTDLVFRFCRLADGSPESIRDFADEWGPLGERLPAFRSGFLGASARRGRNLRGQVKRIEPLLVWRRCAKTFRALLRLTALLMVGERGSREEWEAACEFSTLQRPLAGDGLRARTDLHSMLLQEVLIWGDARPDPKWAPLPAVSVGSRGLLGALGANLVLAFGSPKGIGICDDCESPHLLARRPVSSRYTWCRECSARSAAKFSQRKLRANAKATGGKT